MEIKQYRWGTLTTKPVVGDEGIEIHQYGDQEINIENTSIPAVCAELLKADDCFDSADAFIRMVKILFKGNFTAAGSMLLNCTDVSKPEPEYTGPDPLRQDDKPDLENINRRLKHLEAIWNRIDGSVPNPDKPEPEFEFEWKGSKVKVIDDGNTFTFYMQYKFGPAEWIEASFEDRPYKEFYAKILPWMLARLDYHKEWTCEN